MNILQHCIYLASILFILGLSCILIRRNFLFILIGLEIMINATTLLFITACSYWKIYDGEIMYIIIICITAVETSIGLALLLRLYHKKLTLNINSINEIHE
uniref:NADH-quinone oxidoreductase subunit K n=1 Tax=Candidatus Aschnera chinzeii TaxID=1485666 RepID=A0AAT9G4D4_9ENTR|nr:MAG: NADH-quinone oxidoreductase subunit NuoK [Candidatus Aschnera chinzeii]